MVIFNDVGKCCNDVEVGRAVSYCIKCCVEFLVDLLIPRSFLVERKFVQRGCVVIGLHVDMNVAHVIYVPSPQRTSLES